MSNNYDKVIPESGYTNLLYPGYTPDQMHQEPDAEDQDVPKCTSGPPLRHSPDQVRQEPGAEDKDVSKCTSGPPLRPELYQDAGTEKKLPCISEGQTEGIKACMDRSQDISQISGPGENSSFTPLSQTGFRDPASVGRGQQLTLLSIE
ncbi:DNA polymerase zeta catalytic subunit-like, partial [Trifolium medium]|nr:DNA polymerase zeta catalytic subunit-like [Trifolium medium]